MRAGIRLGCAALSVALACGSAGCGVLGGRGPEEVGRAFLEAFTSGDPGRAARMTDAPEDAAQALKAAGRDLGARQVTAEVAEVHAEPGAGTASVGYTLSWKLGAGRKWHYRSSARLYSRDGEWTVRWRPTILHPELSARQRFAVAEQEPARAPVLDRDGRELLAERTTVSVLLEPWKAENRSAVVAELAGALHPLDEQITRKSIAEGAAEAKRGEPYVVAVLRSGDYQRVRDRIHGLSGVRFGTSTRMISADKDLSPRVLSGIERAVSDDLAGRKGWRVFTVDASGTEVTELHRAPARPADAVRSTLSKETQAAAESALSTVNKPAVLVALRASTGEVLAVAQNEAADERGNIALTGRYPPGSTFKVITAAAALRSGEVTEGTRLDCPATTTVEHRRIPNNDRFDLGTVPLRTAFAKSCNTTFANLAAELPPRTLPEVATWFGLGVDFVMPGATTVTGSVPPAEDVTARAVNGFGQGTVLASPFGMSLVAATVAAGELPTPSLLAGRETKVDTRVGKLPVRVAVPLRHMMREVITVGTGGALDDPPGVRGKTGTAQFGDGSRAHGWFLGYRDDLAFSTLVVGGGTSLPAVRATGRFLRSADD